MSLYLSSKTGDPGYIQSENLFVKKFQVFLKVKKSYYNKPKCSVTFLSKWGLEIFKEPSISYKTIVILFNVVVFFYSMESRLILCM